MRNAYFSKMLAALQMLQRLMQILETEDAIDGWAHSLL
jgi:hypothetical protein